MAGADVLACGHGHHLLVMEQGSKTFMQVPTLGTDGTWWAHQHGSRPNPGIVLALTDGEEVTHIEPVRAL